MFLPGLRLEGNERMIKYVVISIDKMLVIVDGKVTGL